MNIGAGTALLAVVASVLFCMTSAKNVACINANAKILKLWCDGVDYTGQLTSRLDPNQCDCITLPICKIIAIKAKGVRNYQDSRSGIQFCQTSHPTSFLGLDWVCAHAPRVASKRWIRESYNHNQWKSVMRPEGTCRTCHGIKFLPCTSKCFWNMGNPAKSVNCVRKQCADMCNSCDTVGPGGCDPGQCAYGETTHPDETGGQPVCNHKCRVEWKAWDGASGKGYIEVTDMRTNAVDTYDANVAGFYFAVLDLNSCTLVNKKYIGWANYLPEFLAFMNPLGTADTDPALSAYHRIVGLTLAVGTSSGLSPSLGAGLFGVSLTPPPALVLIGQGNGGDLVGYCSATMEFTGISHVIPTAQIVVDRSPC